MRNKFEEQLEQLNVELIKTGALCEDAISAAAEALIHNDASLAAAAEAYLVHTLQKRPKTLDFYKSLT